MITLTLHQIDAFTSEAFRGNPAAVCLLDPADPRGANESWMQRLALEMNLSETAYLIRRGPGRFGLRWFTPGAEAEICGHATLAAAHALWTVLDVSENLLEFETRAGVLKARRAEASGWIELDFPLLPETAAKPRLQAEVARALGVSPVYVGEDPFHIIAELESDSAVRELKADMALLKTIGRDVMITARSEVDPAFDFVSRYFSPVSGIGEDPVTGSAHCMLAPYWGRKLGKTELTGYQASHRGGTVRTQVHEQAGRVSLYGQAVTVARIELLVQ